MTKKINLRAMALTSAACVICASAAFAGNPERSGQSIASIFESGNYAEFSLAVVSPNLTGETATGNPIGDLGDTYFSFGAAYKRDIDEKFSIGLIMDQPWGANITYETDANYGVFSGASTEWKSNAVTALARYKLGNGFSVHGGLRAEKLGFDVNLPAAGALNSIKSSTGYGFTVGAAYEKPAIARRVSLTYHSPIRHKADVTVNGAAGGTTTFDMPQSFNLEFRQALDATTIVFGSVRYTDWKSLAVGTTAFPTLVSYSDNTVQTQLGIGKGFSKEWSGAVMIDIEPATNSPVSDLSPPDGKVGLGVAATYTKDKYKVTGLLKLLSNGDSVSRTGSIFNDNSTVALGMKVSRTF